MKTATRKTAQAFFNTIYKARAEGMAFTVGRLGIQRLRLYRKWHEREHNGAFWGVFYWNGSDYEPCEIDGGVWYEAHRDEVDAQFHVDEANRQSGDRGVYVAMPIPAGTRVADPITETVVTAAAHETAKPERINRQWLAGETHAAARAYVLDYFHSQSLPVSIESTADSMECKGAVDVFFYRPNARRQCFTVWFEPAVNRVYGEW